MTRSTSARTGALGAIPGSRGTEFRVWAPRPREVDLVLDPGGDERLVRTRSEGPYRVATVPGLVAGTRYAYRVDGQGPFPDPCSRRQPLGVHGPSEVVDPSTFPWTDDAWRPPPFADLVIYECHVGTLTRGGTFDAAVRDLRRLRDLGVTAIELMPVASFPGRWNWGYDGVALFAPAEVYGGPDGLRRLVDAAHGEGLAVILDVVYNHFGPDGNYTGLYADEYRTPRYRTPWGDAVNFDGPGSEHVRRFVIENLLHWVREYHVDGFRFDATHAIFDGSPEHLLAEASRSLEGTAPGGTRPYLIAESHENDVRYVRPPGSGGYGFDAVWADDFHHAVRTLLAGDFEGYFRSYDGTIGSLARTMAQGFWFEGQQDPATGTPRGTPARDVPWASFVYCLQNHDQVGNRAFGERLGDEIGRGDLYAATLLLLLLPQTPLLFQGQEFLASTPFLYFTDHDRGLGRLVTEGRRREFAAFAAFTSPGLRSRIPDPQAARTFRRSRLDPAEARVGVGSLAADLHRELLRVRRGDPVLAASRSARIPLDIRSHERAVVVGLAAAGGERLMVANFGEAVTVGLPGGGDWRVVLATDEARFGGLQRLPEHEGTALRVPAHSGAYLSRGDGGPAAGG